MKVQTVWLWLLSLVVIGLLSVWGLGSEDITVMTYNILDGSGVGPTSPTGEWCCSPKPKACCGAPGGNRLPRILDIVKAISPDILGIQEAYLWHLDNNAIARQVANELDMNYFIGESLSTGANVVLFSKFEIVDTENLEFMDRAALRARVNTGHDRFFNIFVAHLIPFEFTWQQKREIRSLTDVISPYSNEPSILMGDMNFAAQRYIRGSDPRLDKHVAHGELIEDAGYSLVAYGLIDHIWISQALEQQCDVQTIVSRGVIPNEVPLTAANLSAASDHYPVAATITLLDQ